MTTRVRGELSSHWDEVLDLGSTDGMQASANRSVVAEELASWARLRVLFCTGCSCLYARVVEKLFVVDYWKSFVAR